MGKNLLRHPLLFFDSIVTMSVTQSTTSSPREINMISGVSFPEHSQNAFLSLQDGRRDGFDYVVTELPVPMGVTSSSSNGASSSGSVGANTSSVRTDVTKMDSRWWSTSVVGSVGDPPNWKKKSSNTNISGSQLVHALTSSSVSAQKKQEAEHIFRGMLEWASHMNIPAVILPTIPIGENDIRNDGRNSCSDDEEDMFDDAPIDKKQENHHKINNNMSSSSIINTSSAKEYARLISQISTSSICTTSRVQLWIRVPLTLPHIQAYQLLLARCDHSPSVGCLLSITSPIDAAKLPAITRALHICMGGGHVKGVSWDVSAFLKNKKGYPTLSKNHQKLFRLIYGRLGRTLRTLVEGQLLPVGLNNNNNDGGSGGGGSGSASRKFHLQYLAHLRSRAAITSLLDSEEGVLETPYLDNLQSPLQPLGDHLEYQTYETFEKDPVKYKRYGEAVELALEDRMKEGKLPLVKRVKSNVSMLRKIAEGEVGEMDLEDLVLENVYNRDGAVVELDVYEATILVVGAGRGPLVRESIAAVARVASSLVPENKALIARVIAIEKNPSAVLYLQSLKSSNRSWNGGEVYTGQLDLYYPHNCGDKTEILNRISGLNAPVPGLSKVTVIGCDMREATSHPLLELMIQKEQFRADIVVSELLGSFGDNELSPECLDGVQRCGVLKNDCVSIPQNYTAFIAPVSSSRLYSEARCQASYPAHPEEGPAAPASGIQRALETPYVVRSHAASQTHSEKACWTFSHPHHSTGMDIENNIANATNASADAAKEINNDRQAHISFTFDSMFGASAGCGYGALNTEMLSGDTTEEADGTNVTIHGFLGSFHSVLYESPPNKQSDGERISVISIAPHSFSVGMFSWFPLYFPLKQPLCAPVGSTVNCSVWRRSDGGRVWYEWCAEVIGSNGNIWSTSSIHNPGGRSYHVRL